MADHPLRNSWGSWGTPALTLVLLVLALLTPAGARAAIGSPAVAIQLPAVDPAAAQSAVSSAVAQASAAAAAAQATVPPAPVSPVASPVASAPAPVPTVAVPPVPVTPASPPPPPVVLNPAPPAPSEGAPGALPQSLSVAMSATSGHRSARPRPAPIGAVALAGAVRRAAHVGARGHARRARHLHSAQIARRTFQSPHWAWAVPPWTPAPPLGRAAARQSAHVVGPSRPARHGVRSHRPIASPVNTAVAIPLPRLPIPSGLPPAGAAGVSSGGAAGAGAAALLALAGIWLLRALLPGLLALGPGPWRTALLVCRLERPG
jgi:hypothetical protein